MQRRIVALGLVILTTSLIANDRDRLSYSGKKWYDAVRAQDAELKWKKIPWLVDLEEGLKQATAEKRPLVIWVSGDDPLDRC